MNTILYIWPSLSRGHQNSNSNNSLSLLPFHGLWKWKIEYISMGTSSSIRHRFDVEISRGKFVEISLILKDESTWKLWHWFYVEISTWIRLSKSTKYRLVFPVDFLMSFRCRIDVTASLDVSFLSFSNVFCSGNLF